MGSRKLKSAVEAAGYAMVNPEDFAGDPRPHLIRHAPPSKQADEKAKTSATSRWWPSLDMFSLSGGKATA
jgi:hypothetical protein